MAYNQQPPPPYYPPPQGYGPQPGSGWVGGYPSGAGSYPSGVGMYPGGAQQQTIMMQPQMNNTQVTVLNTPSYPDSSYQNYGYRVYQKTGIRAAGQAQIVCGVFVLILDTVACGLADWYYSYGYFSGIWCGIFFIIAGALGLNAVTYDSKGRVVGMLVFSIISCLLVVVCIALFSVQIQSVPTSVTYSYFGYANYTVTSVGVAVITLGSFAIIFAIAEGITSIVQSAYGCCELCPSCCPRNTVGPQIESQMHGTPSHHHHHHHNHPVFVSTVQQPYPQQNVTIIS